MKNFKILEGKETRHLDFIKPDGSYAITFENDKKDIREKIRYKYFKDQILDKTNSNIKIIFPIE